MKPASRIRALVLCCISVLVLTALATGCAQQQASPPASDTATSTPIELNVSAAASLKGVLEQTAPAFEKANNAKLVFNFGASGALQKQIEAGTPTDVFLSASPKQVDALAAGDLISADTTATFASNDLVIIVPTANPKGINGPADLAKAGKLSTGDPAVAPVGTSAQEWLTNIGQWDALKPAFVFAQNASQNTDYVARGEVDAGISFASDANGRADVQVVYTVPVGEFKSIKYVFSTIAATKQADLSDKYTEFLLSSEFQQALVDAGFKTAP